VHVVGRALGHDVDRHLARGAHLSINEAAAIAIDALDEAIEEQDS
jgi:hypothetical protein